MKERIVGTRITKRRVVSLDPNSREDQEYLFKAMKSLGGFERMSLQPIEKACLKALRKAGINPSPKHLARVTLPEDSPEWFAEKCIWYVRVIRANREINPDFSLQLSYELGKWYWVAAMKLKWESLVEHGKKFKIDGPKAPRIDALSEVLSRMLPNSNSAILDRLTEGKVIQEVDQDSEMVYWKTPDGREKKTSFKSIQSRLTTLRKKSSKK